MSEYELIAGVILNLTIVVAIMAAIRLTPWMAKHPVPPPAFHVRVLLALVGFSYLLKILDMVFYRAEPTILDLVRDITLFVGMVMIAWYLHKLPK